MNLTLNQTDEPDPLIIRMMNLTLNHVDERDPVQEGAGRFILRHAADEAAGTPHHREDTRHLAQGHNL